MVEEILAKFLGQQSDGEGFYATDGLGVDEVRICYSLDAKDLKKAMNILKEGLIKYSKEVEK